MRPVGEQSEILECVQAFARSFDSQDWPKLEACLSESVYTDYSTFRGTPPQRLQRSGGKFGLPPFPFSPALFEGVNRDGATAYPA